MRLIFVFCLGLVAGVATAAEPGTAPIAAPATTSAAPPVAGIGYPDVASALLDLRGNPDVLEAQQENGWTWYFLQEEGDRMVAWTFAPFNDPAYPAAVKRVLLMRDGALVMETRTMCQAKLASCDAFLAATDAKGKQFAAYFAKEVVANAARVESEGTARARYQEHLKEVARSIYNRR
jgi:hypothetical protein